MLIPHPALSPFLASVRFAPPLFLQGLRVVRLHSSRPRETGGSRAICRYLQLERRKACGGASGGSGQTTKLQHQLGLWLVVPGETA